MGNVAKMLRERFGGARQIGVVTKHDLLLDCEVELGSMAIVAKEDPKRIERLFADFFFLQKVVTPRLFTKVNHWFEMG